MGVFVFLNLFLATLVSVVVRGLSLVAASGGYTLVVELRLPTAGPLLWSLGSKHMSSGVSGLVVQGRWNLPGPGIEGLSPALTGSVLTLHQQGSPMGVV